MTDSTLNPSETPQASDPPAKTDDSSTWSNLLSTGATDFRVVFFYPLCTGIMTGVGFIMGKRLGEKYFYGGVGKSP